VSLLKGVICARESVASRYWKQFLLKDDNKKQLTEVMFNVWSSETFKEKFQNRKVILIKEGAAHEVSGDRNAIP